MELTIENLRTLSCSGQIFLTAHSQARLYERGIHEDALWILTAYWPDLDHWNASYTERKKKGE